jgi:hypothetical protein
MTETSESPHPNRDAFPPGMSGPALRALATAGIRSLDDLVEWTEAEVAALHGMGPKGIRVLGDALAASNRGFRRS